MAEGVRLDLQVGLDTAYLRNQLNTIGTKLGGQTITLPINFDRRDIVTKTKALQKYIGNKTFDIKIESNTLQALTDKVQNFQRRLQELKSESITLDIAVGGLASISERDAKKVKRDLRDAVLGEEKKIFISTSIRPSVPRKDVRDFTNAVKSKLAGLSVKVKADLDASIDSSSLGTLATQIDTLQNRLQALRSEPTVVKITAEATAATSPTDAAKIKRDLRDAILGEDKKIFIPASIVPRITRDDVRDFANAVKSKLSGLSVKVKADLEMSAVRGGAKSQAEIDADVLRGYEAISRMGAERMKGGKVTEAARREQLKQRLSTGEFDISQLRDIGAQLGIKGTGRFRNTQNLIEKIVAEASVEMIKKYLDPQAVMRNPNRGPLQQVLDTFARGMFQMLGMDPAAMKEQARQKLLPPAINWPAQTPPPRPFTGPSSTGRALPPGAIPAALPGTSFASQKRLVGDILSPSLKEALRGAANAFVDTVRAELNAAVRQVSVRDFGSTAQRALRAQRIAGLLPPAVGREPNIYSMGSVGGETRAEMLARREYEARMRSELRGIGLGQHFTQQRRLPGTTFMGDEFTAGGGRDRVRGVGQPPERGGALAVAGGPSTKLPENYFENMKRMNAAIEVARSSLKNFSRDQLPLIGGLRGLAGEFGMAAKQVLLYGTAYKGLAFITSLPGQILNAAKGQQQFANSMQVATDKTKTFSKEMLFVDNIQRAYGLNLDTTRQGFVRLFASMAPSGFDSGSIEKLFTGISAATAALQLTPDKAERVIYAFGQMASKGQVMSEELKGQLGDVLPGALSIFADAAGKSISEFNKDLEDGVYQGEKFRELMAKVTDELIDRFGTGAQIAGRSLQGLLNTVQGDFQRTLEAFSPLANAAAQAILTPIGGALRQLSMSAQLATGEVDRVKKQLEDQQKIVSDLKIGGADADQIRAAEQNVAALQARLEMLNEAAKDPAIQKQAQDIQRFTQELAKAGTFVMNVAQTIGGILSPVLSLLGGNLTTVIALVTSVSLGFQAMRLAAMVAMGALVAFRAVTAALGLTETARSATAVAAALKMLGINASGATVQIVGTTTALRALAAATVIGAVVTGITLIAGAFLSMRDSANQAKKAAVESLKASREAALSGNVLAVEAQLTETRARQLSLRDFAKALEKQKASGNRPPSQELIKAAQDAGIVLSRTGGSRARAAVVDLSKATSDLNAQFKLNNQLYSEQQKNREKALQRQKQLGLNQPTPSPSLAETVTPGTDTAKPTEGTAARESRVPLLELELATAEQIMEIERQMMTARLSGNELEVIRLEGLKEQVKINEQIAKIKLDKQTPAEEKSLQIQKLLREGDQARLKTSFELEKKIAETLAQIRERTVDIRKAAEEELADKKKYDRLVAEGILPSVAKITVEVERQFAIEQEKLELLRKDIERQISLLEKQKEATKDAEERLKIEKELALLKGERDTVTGVIGTLPSMSAETIQAKVAVQAGKPVDYLQDAIDETTKNLERLTDARYQAVEAANAIGNAFGNAFKGLITGSMTAQEALANMFQSIADSFADMVAQMIADWIRMQILGIVKAIFSAAIPSAPAAPVGAPAPPVGAPAPPAGFANGGIAIGGFKAFASGGVVTGPTLGLVGEGRYNEAIVPLPDGKSIPVELNTSMFNAADQFAANRAAMNGSMAAQSAASPFEANRQAMMTAQSAIASKDAERTVDKVISASMQPMKINYETQVINNVEYVTSEQFQRGMNQAAEKGRALTMGALKNSVKARRQIGI